MFVKIKNTKTQNEATFHVPIGRVDVGPRLINEGGNGETVLIRISAWTDKNHTVLLHAAEYNCKETEVIHMNDSGKTIDRYVW